jgi:hypothetical protein
MAKRIKKKSGTSRGTRGPGTAPEFDLLERSFLLKRIPLSVEDQEQFAEFARLWQATYPPRDMEELSLLEDLIATEWRRRRYERIYQGLVNQDLELQKKLRARGNPLQPDPSDPHAALAHSFRGNKSLAQCGKLVDDLQMASLRVLDRLKKLRERPIEEIVPLRPPEPPSRLIVMPTPKWMQ